MLGDDGQPVPPCAVNDPVPPREVEFLLDDDVDGHRVGSVVIATGLESIGGNVVLPRVIHGKPALTVWLDVCDAAEALGADHINYRNSVVVAKARKILTGDNTAPVVGREQEQAG